VDEWGNQTLIYGLLAVLPSIASVQRPDNIMDAYAVYSEMRGNGPVGGCGCYDTDQTSGLPVILGSTNGRFSRVVDTQRPQGFCLAA
jgi:hypothetical protein